MRSYLGLLCLGKNDFDAIEGFRTDAFFKRSLGLQTVPSSPTMQWCLEREGKRFCVWQETLELERVGTKKCPARRIYRLTERTINKHGQPLLLPEYVLEGWTTTLDASFKPLQVIALYCDHWGK